jgi:hypothetical protein
MGSRQCKTANQIIDLRVSFHLTHTCRSVHFAPRAGIFINGRTCRLKIGLNWKIAELQTLMLLFLLYRNFLTLPWLVDAAGQDFNAPEHAPAMLKFVKRINEAWSGSSPILVHCSAGVGRSGTLIAIDSLTQVKYTRPFRYRTNYYLGRFISSKKKKKF